MLKYLRNDAKSFWDSKRVITATKLIYVSWKSTHDFSIHYNSISKTAGLCLEKLIQQLEKSMWMAFVARELSWSEQQFLTFIKKKQSTTENKIARLRLVENTSKSTKKYSQELKKSSSIIRTKDYWKNLELYSWLVLSAFSSECFLWCFCN